MATIDWPERLLLRLSIGGHEAEGKVWTHARRNAAAKARSGERADQIDLSWLSPAERAALRRQLNRLRASKAAQESPSSEAGENRRLEASYGLIAVAGAARTSREDEVRYRVGPNIWDLPQCASIPYDQLVSDCWVG